MLSMILMNVDGRIGILYNEILGQLEDEKRAKSIDELKSLKEIRFSFIYYHWYAFISLSSYIPVAHLWMTW